MVFKIFARIVFWTAAGLALAFAAGVRLNLRAVKAAGASLGSDKKSSEIRLKNGSTIAAEVVAQSRDSVTVNLGGGTVVFSRGEIESVRELAAGEDVSAKGGPEVVGRETFLTYDSEKNLLKKIPGLGGKKGEPGTDVVSKLSGWLPDFSGGANYSAVREQARRASRTLSSRANN